MGVGKSNRKCSMHPSFHIPTHLSTLLSLTDTEPLILTAAQFSDFALPSPVTEASIIELIEQFKQYAVIEPK